MDSYASTVENAVEIRRKCRTEEKESNCLKEKLRIDKFPITYKERHYIQVLSKK